MSNDVAFGSQDASEASHIAAFLDGLRCDDPRVSVVIGVAGAGKTSWAIDRIEQLLRDGYRWSEIGFTSFSRAACREAAERAAKIVGESAETLQNEAFYRTMHSAAVRLTGIDTKLILDRTREADREWFADCFGVPPGGEAGTLGHLVQSRLELWDLSRAKLLPVMSAPYLMSWAAERLDDVPRESFETLMHAVLASRPVGPVNGQSFCATSGHGFASENTGFLSRGQSISYLYRGELVPTEVRGHEGKMHGLWTEGELSPYRSKSYDPDSRAEVTGQNAGDWPLAGQILELWRRWAKDEGFLDTVHAYEKHKRLYGRIDFSDILLRLAGVEYANDCSYVQRSFGGRQSDVKVWICDEYQDCSRLLDFACRRLWDGSESVYLLGDGYQAVYGFSGAQRAILCDWEKGARKRGGRLILNRSWRNPESVLEWGEQVLREDKGYEERKPFCEGEEGSVGLVEWNDWVKEIGRVAECTDVMVVGRTWWNVQWIQRALDERGIPWSSLSEEHKSRWDSPAKLAFVLVMRDLLAGKMISEQDWRRVTENLKQKHDGIEVFRRGVKAEWAKMACSAEPSKTLSQVHEWGAGPGFVPLLQGGAWKEGMYGILDTAIDRFGVERIRRPSIRVGTCHSVKGLQAKIVFCLATSTELASTESDEEALSLRYVTITRASRHYRLIVNQLDVSRGKPQFWAAPKGYWQFDKEMEFLNERDGEGWDSRQDPEVAGFGGDLECEVRGVGLESQGDTRHPLLRDGENDRNGDEATGEGSHEDSGVRAETDLEEWWNFGPN
jgi:superfamily I DNA/RNA helicase